MTPDRTPRFRPGPGPILASLTGLALAASPAWGTTTELLLSPTGANQLALFGFSVSGAGDWNADGFDDFIVGAYQDSVDGSYPGRAYVYYGGPLTDETPDMVFTGADTSDNFGISVASAGDVNGDGFDDLIVGALLAGASAEGAAYIYDGGPSADSSALLTLTGEAADDGFGRSVAAAGDVNGDGFDDVIVGAYQNDSGGSNAGRAYVYYGGSSMDAIPDLILTGEAMDDFFGGSVAGAGDPNGDGFPDVIVGAWGHNMDTGRAYVFYGGLAPDTTADRILDGEAFGDIFGTSVAGAGDVNGDGRDDLVIGAYQNDAGGNVSGRTYLYFGGGDTAADVTITGASGAWHGLSVGAAGDVNRDGYDDVIVGAAEASSGGAGRALVYFGGLVADTTADVILLGEGAADVFGGAVGMAGDVNGDGLDDLIVGAYWNDDAGTDAGRVYVYSAFTYDLLSPNGGEQWIAGESATVRWKGRDLADLELTIDGGLSWSLLAAGVGGDVDNEHTVIVPIVPTEGALVRVKLQGQPADRSNSDASESLFRILERVAPPAIACVLDRTLTGEAATDRLGISAAGAGDVNGDGFDDFLVGAFFNDGGGGDAGRAYVYHGGPSAGPGPDLTLDGEGAGDNFGISVDGAGDVNGDGFDDVIVGAYSNGVAGVNAGRAYVFHGGPSADATPDLTLTGEASGDRFGGSVGGAGDVNGDGFDDVIVGGYLNGAAGLNAGRAYVFHGGPAADPTPDLILTAEAAGDAFGISVGGAGDVNGDGFHDVVVGAYLNDAAGATAGRAYVFFGGPSADATADMILTGEAAGDNFGFSVSAAGDMNGDGFDDVIVGADDNDAAGDASGRAYLFQGGSFPDATADLILTGEAAANNFGTSVRGAGDVNGDGFDDVIVGALFNDAVAVDAGRAYVYFGGPAPDATADLTLSGEAGGDSFGRSVAAGDLNGDGFHDLIVGAFGSDAGGADAGRAYTYDCNRYFVTSPTGGQTWNVGATETVSWLGAEPADVTLSVDGGGRFLTLATAVGGRESNALQLVVPHLPTRFARVQVTPSDASVHGSGRSDSLFTIDSSISLLSFQATLGEGSEPQAIITWRTDPEPEDLSTYRLDRSDAGSPWRTLVETLETRHVDPGPSSGSRYRLTAVNGLGHAYVLGEATVGSIAPLAAWPLPYRGGPLHVSFGTGGIGGGPSRAELFVVDVAGRRVRTLVTGELPSGYHRAAWDGRDERGRPAAAGIYFLRVHTPGNVRSLKVAVIR